MSGSRAGFVRASQALLTTRPKVGTTLLHGVRIVGAQGISVRIIEEQVGVRTSDLDPWTRLFRYVDALHISPITLFSTHHIVLSV